MARSAAWACIAALIAITAPRVEAATISGGSDLLYGAGLAQLEDWLVNDPTLDYAGPLFFTNVFDKAAGDTAADFHAAADGLGPTVFVAEAKIHGSADDFITIGGFNPRSWSGISPGDFNYTPDLADQTAFIFDLTHGDRREQVNEFQTYNYIGYGPTFGIGHDIFIGDNLSLGSVVARTYCGPNGDCTGTANILGTLGLEDIDIGRLEVFTVAPIPVPPAAPFLAAALAGLGLAGWRRKRLARDP